MVFRLPHRHPVLEQDRKPVQCRFPVADRHGQFHGYVTQRQIEQLHDRIVVWERAPTFGDLAQAHVDRLDGGGFQASCHCPPGANNQPSDQVEAPTLNCILY
jgi:hypothetical protein